MKSKILQPKFKTYEQALTWVFSQRPSGNFLFPGNKGHKRIKLLLKQIGNPQESFKAIHIAGTSGKGSTASLISKLLAIHEYRVGLMVSPHLLDPRERIQLNNELITKEDFLTVVNETYDYYISFNVQSNLGELTFFEIITVLAFVFFKNKKVDYAVIETGIGGLLDASNSIKRSDKLSVITDIGYDHTELLGNTLGQIAQQKAGIINHKSTVITIKQADVILATLRSATKAKRAKLIITDPIRNFDYELISYQKRNLAVALKVIEFLAKRDHWQIEQKKVLTCVKNFTLTGRFDLIENKYGKFILDGAHNPQKMKAFLNSLEQKYPQHKKFNFIVGFKRRKKHDTMLTQITKLAETITLSPVYFTFPKLTSIGENTKILATELQTLNFHAFSTLPNEANGLKEYLQKTKHDLTIITGSLYLIAQVYQIFNDNRSNT